MDSIHRQVRRARFRLTVEQFIQRFLWCGFFALLIASIGIAIPKLLVLSGLPVNWTAICFGVSGIAALLGATIWTIACRKSDLEAAVELDLRYGLKERIASTLFLEPSDLDTRAGKALLDDAVRRVERIDVAEQFGISLGKRPWLPIVPALIALALVFFVDDRTKTNEAEAASKLVERKIVPDAAEEIRKQVKRKKKEAIAKGLKDAEALFTNLEKQTKDFSKKKNSDKKKAVVKLNDLAKQIEDRRKKLGGGKDLKKQLQKLGKMNKGPAEKLGKAIKSGNLNKAIKEIKKLNDKLAQGKLSEKEKKQLKKQLNEMKKNLQNIADKQQQAMQDLKKKIEEQKKQGNTQNAANMQDQLDKMAQSKPQLDALQKMAQKMGECQQCMQKGDNAGAQKAMQQLAQQLQNMQKQESEQQMLSEMMQQLQQAKQQMTCQQCGGKGCKACNGQGNKLGQSKGGKSKSKKPGNGLGEGKGFGKRPETENAIGFVKRKVQQKVGAGRAFIEGAADGKNVKGRSLQAIKQSVESGERMKADPVTVERLSKSRREHVEQYIDSINNGG